MRFTTSPAPLRGVQRSGRSKVILGAYLLRPCQGRHSLLTGPAPLVKDPVGNPFSNWVSGGGASASSIQWAVLAAAGPFNLTYVPLRSDTRIAI
jgi:hypothetical protein